MARKKTLTFKSFILTEISNYVKDERRSSKLLIFWFGP
jgi:hypothetical protein